MDQITTAIAVSSATSVVTEALRKNAVEFLQKVLKKGASTALDSIKSGIAERRRANTLIVLDLAGKKLGSAKVEPTEVHDQVLLPLLYSASLEDEFESQNLWANLLANAADPRGSAKVQPAFVAILRELTTPQARFIKNLYDGQMVGPAGYVFPVEFDEALLRQRYWSANSIEVDKHQPMPDVREANLAVDVLKRQQLLIETTEVVLPGGPSGPAGLNTRQVFRLTQLGYSFISSVRPPLGCD